MAIDEQSEREKGSIGSRSKRGQGREREREIHKENGSRMKNIREDQPHLVCAVK